MLAFGEFVFSQSGVRTDKTPGRKSSARQGPGTGVFLGSGPGNGPQAGSRVRCSSIIRSCSSSMPGTQSRRNSTQVRIFASRYCRDGYSA